ncbi:MAG: hypothetical protein IJ153_02420 [Clostridia bacterium]|nr:hypothetical protein [Clostridia bacterium]
MNKRKVAVGPGASSLILIAVVLALSVLTVLTMISARNDEALALRSVETRQEVYGLFAEGERSLAKLDAVLMASLAEAPAGEEEYLARVAEQLPEGMKMKGDIVSWTEKIGDRALACAVKVLAPGAEKRTAWTLHRLEAEDIWEEDDFGDWEDEDQEAEEDEMNAENEGEEAQ